MKENKEKEVKSKVSKKYLMFGVLGLFAVALVSAGLLQYYGEISTNIQVKQPIGFFVEGDGTNHVGESVSDSVACDSGQSCLSTKTYKITNDADYPIDVKLVTTGNTGAIDTNYVGKLLLEDKSGSPDWNIIVNERKADLVYTVVGNEFGYSLDAEGLTPETSYSLIYYADKPDKFVNWGGNNPGAMIVIANSDELGNLVVEGNVELGMNLPSDPDANIDEYDYSGVPDNYLHAHGAKIWLVPSGYLPLTYPNDGSWMTWSSEIVSNILFETDLIWYSDSVDTLTVPANSFIEFTPEYKVGALANDTVTYTIETSILPVTA